MRVGGEGDGVGVAFEGDKEDGAAGGARSVGNATGEWAAARDDA